ncbi:MAG: Rrf2 family transcriptional regulator [Eubacteriaceae bacterium]|uniref:Rrf2 family transcriptional regulator n=1 Tax=Candidatus Pseudoramibacter fermentans TaxID=2594427 RepID=A0A6L5GQE7_9FIRM|nr:Rrf2 family transcriptional regulator [Candidatus Pseudoramibacter fermentans]RRF92895.1 MAG: Rrf2 family transcriptional regulator [Eubacteriaceae bacterium]
MRISAKGRYGLAAMVELTWLSANGKLIPVATLSDHLGISKIYLEQIFSLLKRGKLVTSVKGAQGGYRLARDASEISVYDILSALEQTLFEPTESSVEEKAPTIESILNENVYDVLDQGVKDTLSKIKLSHLLDEYVSQKNKGNYMFYI